MKLKHSLYILPLAGSLAIMPMSAGALSSDPFFGDVADVKQANYSGDGHALNLAANYREFVVFEIDEMLDWFDAEHFAKKAKAAAAGQQVNPEDPNKRDIADKAAKAELMVQHDRLVRALGTGGIEKAPVQIAIAQAKFDCWVEQQEEAWQTWDIAACKNAYMAAMGLVDVAMAPTVAVAPPPPVSKLRDDYLVFFDFDKSTIRPESALMLNEVATIAISEKINTVEVTAFTDSSGSAEYNQSLSERRALAVLTYLRGRGVEARHVTTVGHGERDQRVVTADDVREQENRRVHLQFH